MKIRLGEVEKLAKILGRDSLKDRPAALMIGSCISLKLRLDGFPASQWKEISLNH